MTNRIRILPFALLLIACRFLFPTPTAIPPEADIRQTLTAEPTLTLAPTLTLEPTITPEPTLTQVPASTAIEASPTPEDTADILEGLGGQPCPGSEFTCIRLAVPLDHFDEANGETIEVVFGVLPATGERKGMFVTAVGGPGYSGLPYADSYTEAFDPSITEHFDIVFFDQRGLWLSGDLQCVDAATAFYLADWQTKTPEQEAAFLETARTFAEDCISEMGLPVEELPYYSTRQAVEDLEVFRQAMGDGPLWLYGESYGTQYAQAFATAHPENLAGLILDGTVDLTLSGPDYYAGAVQSFYDTLIETLEACNEDRDCAADFGGDAVAFYDELSAELFAARLTVDFPLPSGKREPRTFSFSDLESVVGSSLYSPPSRHIFLRALAAAYRGDLVPFTRLLYIDLFLDPETLERIPDPTYSDGVYYTVECNDYTFYSGSPDERAEAWLRQGDEIESSQPYMSSIFYGDMPCVYWPAEGAAERPSALTAEGIPTLVLGATADPITPVEYGTNVFEGLDDGYLIKTEGGAHVIFGRGDPCPDEIVTAFLVEGITPDERETICDGVLFDPYVPLFSSSAADFADPLEAMMAADFEIFYLPEYYYWDYATPTSVGCPFGGTLQFEATATGDLLTLEDCAFAFGFRMTGIGWNDFDAGFFTLEVAVSGVGSGDLNYVWDANSDIYTLTGDYNGEEVDLSE